MRHLPGPCAPAILLLAAALGAAERPPVLLFAEDFERFEKKNWDEFGKDPSAVEVVDGGFRGKCVRITADLEKNTGAHLYKLLQPGLDTCHLRFYVKFEK